MLNGNLFEDGLILQPSIDYKKLRNPLSTHAHVSKCCWEKWKHPVHFCLTLMGILNCFSIIIWTASLFDKRWSFVAYHTVNQMSAWFIQHNCSNEPLRASASGLAFLLLFWRSTMSFTLLLCHCLCGAPRDSLGCLVHGDDRSVEMVFKWKGKCPTGCYLSKTGCRVSPTALKQNVGSVGPRPSEQWWWILWSSSRSALQLWPTWWCAKENVRDTSIMNFCISSWPLWYKDTVQHGFGISGVCQVFSIRWLKFLRSYMKTCLDLNILHCNRAVSNR